MSLVSCLENTKVKHVALPPYLIFNYVLQLYFSLYIFYKMMDGSHTLMDRN